MGSSVFRDIKKGMRWKGLSLGRKAGHRGTHLLAEIIYSNREHRTRFEVHWRSGTLVQQKILGICTEISFMGLQ